MKNLEIVLLISVYNNSILGCLYKWKLIELYEYHRPKWLKFQFCFYCLSFWTSIAILFLWYYPNFQNPLYLLRIIFLSFCCSYISALISPLTSKMFYKNSE